MHHVYKDFYDFELFKELEEDGIFTQDTDMAFVFTTDGIQTIKDSAKYTSWPLVLLNLNIPSSIRFIRDEVFVIGSTTPIDGKGMPKDLESFLWPIIYEFKRFSLPNSHISYKMEPGRAVFFPCHAFTIRFFPHRVPSSLLVFHLCLGWRVIGQSVFALCT